MTEKQIFNQNFLRTVALTIAVIGAACSLFFMFNAGRNQNSIILLGLFTGWVLSPFAGLFIVDRMSGRWGAPARAALFWLIIILTIGSVVAYSGVLLPPDTKTAFIFLVAPLASWVIIATTFLITRRISNMNSDPDQTNT